MRSSETNFPTARGFVQPDEIRDYFSNSALYWRRIYDEERLIPRIYRERREATLEWIRQIKLPAGSRVLEVGCGAGLTSVALAQSGYVVNAMDSSEEMVELTRQEATRAGVGEHVCTALGDVHALDFPDACFDLVIAVGVIPWLQAEARGVAEMARVLKPGGYLIITADNRARLNRLLDPLSTPLLAPVRLAVKTALRAIGRRSKFHVKMHYPHQVDALCDAARLHKIARRTVGFGPFTLFGGHVLTDAAGLKLHRKLQHLSDRGTPGLRWTGSHYLLLARKPGG